MITIADIPIDVILYMKKYLNLQDKFSFHLTNKTFSTYIKVFEESDFECVLHIMQKIPVIQYPSFLKTERIKHLIIVSEDEHTAEKMKEKYKYPFYLDCSIKIILYSNSYIYIYLIDDNYNKETELLEYLKKYKRKLKIKY